MAMPAVRTESRSSVRIGVPPGPREPSILQAIRIWRGYPRFIEDCARRFGDTFTIRLPGMPLQIAFSDPEAVREIFTGDGDGLRAGEANFILEPILGRHSLLLLDGARHVHERRLMLPPFHGERMQKYGEAMAEIARRRIEGWPIGRPFPVHPETQAITFEVILRTVFGLGGGERVERLRSALLRFIAVAANPLVLLPALQVDLGPLTPWGRFVRLRRDVHDLLLAEIRERRAAGAAGRDDILSMLVEARDEEGRPMSDEELRDEMLTLLLAGHETTATALAWACGRLADHPDVAELAREEVRRILGDEPLRGERIGELAYVDAFAKETLRLNPILPDVGRRLLRPMTIGGWELPAGVVAAPSIYLAHRRPDVWPEPERFRPERFLGARPNAYAFFPFGGGLRRCLGMAFALYEMKVVLAELLRTARLRPVPGYRPTPVLRAITLAPSKGMMVIADRE